MFFLRMLLILLPLLAFLWWRMLPGLPPHWRRWSWLPFLLLFLLPVVYRTAPETWSWLNTPVFFLSAFWLVFLGNWLLTAVPFELGVRGWALVTRRPAAPLARRGFRYLLWAVLAVSAVFTLVGYVRSLDFRVDRHVLIVNKPLEKPLRLVGIADVHIDHGFPSGKLLRLRDTLTALQPDLILHLGDLSDISPTFMDRLGLGVPLRALHARLGSYGVTGNHEAYMERRGKGTLAWQHAQGIELLRDAWACLPSVEAAELCLSGREDQQYSRSAQSARTPLTAFAPPAEVVSRVPWILLDHQPLAPATTDLPSGSPRPDLGLSGHTHAGQFFPWNLVIYWVWPLVQGAGSLGEVPWIVSAGFGQWGPPVRVGTTPDILFIEIRGREVP